MDSDGVLVLSKEITIPARTFSVDLHFFPFRRNPVNPEEARARLMELLEGQAEFRRQPPQVYYVEHDEIVRQSLRRFVRVFAVETPDLNVVCLDFWLRVAGGHEPPSRRAVQPQGTYTPERGWRIDGTGQPAEADVYDLLMGALAIDRQGQDYVRTISIRALY